MEKEGRGGEQEGKERKVGTAMEYGIKRQDHSELGVKWLV